MSKAIEAIDRMVRDCCGSHAGETFCESYGCGTLSKLRELAEQDAAELARLREIEAAAKETVLHCRNCGGKGETVSRYAFGKMRLEPCERCGRLHAALAAEHPADAGKEKR